MQHAACVVKDLFQVFAVVHLFVFFQDPTSAHQYLGDPEIGPVLMQLHDVAMTNLQEARKH